MGENTVQYWMKKYSEEHRKNQDLEKLIERKTQFIENEGLTKEYLKYSDRIKRGMKNE